MTRTVRKAPAAIAALVAALAATALAGTPAVDLPRMVEVIVRGASAASARDAVERHGGAVLYDLPIVDGVAAELQDREVAAVSTDPIVRDVTPNLPLRIHGGPYTSGYRQATAVYPSSVRANLLWKERIDGRGVTVAVVDTGIAKVLDLGDRVVGGVDLTEEGNPFADSFGHGTFVAGLIAGDGTSSKGANKGVAPEANLVAIKIAGRNGASDVTHVLAALQWAVSFKDTYGIRVLNLSLGTDSTQPYQLSPLNFAVERAWDSGIVVVVSSSNSGPGAGTVTKPGDDPLVITLGALDDRGTAKRSDDAMTDFSGRGPTASDGLAKPDLVAPGRSVISLRSPGSLIDTEYPDSRIGTAYFKGSGTSFSTAVTSGAAALMLQREPGLSPNQVKDRMLRTATPGPVGDPTVDGRGSLDAYAASKASTFSEANQGVARSLGTGSLDADRGTLEIEIETGGFVGGLTATILTLLAGDLTAQDKLFDQTEYVTVEWNGSRWYTSQWAGSRWYGSRWYGSRWYGSRWYSTDWYGSRWYGTAWE